MPQHRTHIVEMIGRKRVLLLKDVNELLCPEKMSLNLMVRDRKMHLIDLLSSQRTQTPVGNQLANTGKFYFLLEIFGIDHVVVIENRVIHTI